MKMKLTDPSGRGSLYSSPRPGVVGVWFGGWTEANFLGATEALEEKRPGVSEEIVAEAHYLVLWLYKFPQIGFFCGVVLCKSLLAGLLLFGLAFIFEYIRFYMFGASPFLSHLSRVWGYIKVPLFIIAAVSLWPQGMFLPIALAVILIGSTLLLMPMNVIASRIVHTTFSEKLAAHYGEDWFKMTALALALVIDRWKLKLLPTNPIF